MAAAVQDPQARKRAEAVIERAGELARRRQPHEPVWEEIRDFILPEAASALGREAPAAKTRRQVLDNTGEQANETLAAALVGTLTPPNSDWFVLRVADDALNRDHEVRLWLDDCAERMHAVFRAPEANFTGAQLEKYAAVVAFGTGAQFVAQRPGRGLGFTSLPLRQVLIDEDAEGRIDCVYRRFRLTARQALGKWGEALPEAVRRAGAGGPGERGREFNFVHAVEPRWTRDPDSPAARNLPFASTYVCVEEAAVVAEGGFHEMPYLAPRWTRGRPEEVWGRGPGRKALPDVKSLQRMMRTTLRGGEKIVDPPLLAADDGIVGPIRTGSSAITYYRSGAWSLDPIKALNTGARPDIGEELMQSVRGRIDAAYYKHLILMLRRDRMTATEVLRVSEEGQVVLGPFLGNLQAEDLGPLITRVFGLMRRAGAFRPMPRALAGRRIEVEYVSPAAKRQRVARVSALAQFLDVTTPLMQLDATVADNLDTDRIFRDGGDAVGMPADWFRAEARVAEMRQARAEEARRQAEAAENMAAVDTAANAVRALPALQQAGGGDGPAA